MSIFQVPVSFEGLIASYVGFPQSLGDVYKSGTLIGWHLRRTDDLTAQVDATLRVGGSSVATPSIAATASDSLSYALSQAVTAGQSITLEVTGTPSGMNLNGFVFIEFPDTGGGGAAPSGDDLTTLSRVKDFMKITTTSFDTYLQQVITETSVRMQQWMGRKISGEVITGEYIDSIGSYEILVRGYPVQSVEAIRFDGADQDLAGLIIYTRTGALRWSDGRKWPWALNGIEVDYTFGYTSVPEDLMQAADKQAAWDFDLSKQGQNRLGQADTVLATGGTSAYDVTPEGWIKSVASAMARYKRLPEAV